MSRKNLPDGIKILRYAVVHQWDAPSPIHFNDLHEGWFNNGGYAFKYKKIDGKKKSRSNRKADVESRLRKIEKLNFFTNEQKVHLLWILSWPVNEEFEKMLRNEGHQLELTEPERLIAFFRSRDGSFERRAPQQNQPTLETAHDEAMDTVELNQPSQDDSLMNRTPQGPPKLIFSQMRLTHAMRMLQWFSKNSGNITSPIPSSIVCQCWLAKIKPKKERRTSMRVNRDRVESTMSNPESLPGFTTEQKVQLLFLLSLPVNEAFENILKSEGHEVELSDPERLITFFKSRDGTLERKATLQEHKGVCDQEKDHLDDIDVVYEDIDLSRYFTQGGMVKREPEKEYDDEMVAERDQLVAGSSEPQDYHYNDVNTQQEWNQQTIKEEPMTGPSDEYNRVNTKQEPHHNDDMNAPPALDQQSDAESSILREIKLEPEEFVNIAVGNPSPSPPLIEQPVPFNPVPSISGSLRILRASVMALRAPGLEKTQNLIEDAIKIHGNNINPVPIANVVLKLSPITFFATQGNPRNEQEKQMSRKAYLQFFLQFLILLNSNQLDNYQEEIAVRIDLLDDSAKIRVDSVKHALNTLLKAIIT